MSTQNPYDYEQTTPLPEGLSAFLDLAPRHKRFWVICDNLLSQGTKPTPSLMNINLARDRRRGLDAVECKIRTYLMTHYGYTFNGLIWVK